MKDRFFITTGIKLMLVICCFVAYIYDNTDSMILNGIFLLFYTLESREYRLRGEEAKKSE